MMKYKIIEWSRWGRFKILYDNCVSNGFKKMWIYPHLGGWVSQDEEKIHTKNMPLKSNLSHFKPTFFFTFLGGMGQTSTVKQHPRPTSAIATQQHSCHQHPSLPTNTTNPPALTPTATTHHSQQPLIPPTTSIRHRRNLAIKLGGPKKILLLLN